MLILGEVAMAFIESAPVLPSRRKSVRRCRKPGGPAMLIEKGLGSHRSQVSAHSVLYKHGQEEIHFGGDRANADPETLSNPGFGDRLLSRDVDNRLHAYDYDRRSDCRRDDPTRSEKTAGS